MLLQSLRGLYFAPGGPGSIWKYLEELVRSTGVSGKIASGFRTDLHFADADRAILPGWKYFLLMQYTTFYSKYGSYSPICHPQPQDDKQTCKL
jgi:hypothetical protein